MPTRTLTPLEQQLLAFEEYWEGRIGSKAAAIRSTFGWRPIAYEQKLQALLKDPAALAAQPQLVRRAIERRERLATARRLRLVG